MSAAGAPALGGDRPSPTPPFVTGCAADAFIGGAPDAPWGGVYGGLVVAQALHAAVETVPDDMLPHALRAAFLSAARPGRPLRYQVERTREGRSIVSRRIVARQGDDPVLELQASFSPGEASVEHQRAVPPAVPRPDALAADSWSDVFERRPHRPVPGSGDSSMWLRWADPLGVDWRGHALAHVYLSDDVPSEAIKALVLETERDFAEFRKEWFAVSLDHSMWIHARSRADDWHLHTFRCRRFVAGRGLSVGEVFAADGTHVATVAQEMLFRRRRKT